MSVYIAERKKVKTKDDKKEKDPLIRQEEPRPNLLVLRSSTNSSASLNTRPWIFCLGEHASCLGIDLTWRSRVILL